MRGKNGTRPRGLSIGGDSMCLSSDDPLMQGLAIFGNGGLLLSHTPPNFTPGSYEVSHMKRARAGSISGRLRSASDLEEKGVIDKNQKGTLKDLIIAGDSELQAALDRYYEGDSSQMQAFVEAGMLDRRDSLDLLENLDFSIMGLGMSENDNLIEAMEPVAIREDEGQLYHNQKPPPPPPPPPPSSPLPSLSPLSLLLPTAMPVAAGFSFSDVSGIGVGSERLAAADSTAAVVQRSTINRINSSGSAEDATTTAGASTAGGGGKVSTQRGGSAQVGGVAVESLGGGGGPAGSGGYTSHDQHFHLTSSGIDSSDHEIDLGCEGTGHFDIGDMAFDTTFDHDYAVEQEIESAIMKDIDENDGENTSSSSSSSSSSSPPAASAVDDDDTSSAVAAAAAAADAQAAAKAAAVAASALNSAVGTAVGPLRVVSASQLTPSHLVERHEDDDDDRPQGHNGLVDDHGNGAGGRAARARGVIADEDDAEVVLRHNGGVDAPKLGSFSAVDAVIGDFSPQFKFSFTEDIHLDLGGGLKDELRDLESFSESLPDQIGKVGGDLMGLGGESFGAGFFLSRAQELLLSRGGPTIKPEPLMLHLGNNARRGATRSGTAAAIAAATAAASSSANGPRSEQTGGDTATGSGTGAANASGYSTNHYASGAAYNARHTGAYATTAAAAAAASSKGTEVYREGGAVQVGQGSGGVTPHHVARGRPVVSGMGIMVGGGPRTGMSMGGGGGDGEERKYVGAYSPEARRQRIQRFMEKREHRVWTKMVKYDVRKNFADTRMRVKGRFVKKEDEALLREVMACA